MNTNNITETTQTTQTTQITLQNVVPRSVALGELGVPRLMAVPSNLNDNGDLIVENVWMNDETKVDRAALLKQWNDVYKIMSIDSPTFIMADDPTTEKPSNDLIYAANSGIALKGKDGVTKYVVSRFNAESRRSETEVIEKFVSNIFGPENVIVPPAEFNDQELFFEGEADMKAIHFNNEDERADVYIMGVGIRTNEAACKWFEATFDIKVIPYKAPADLIESLYHLDCLVFPIDKHTTICNTHGIAADTIKEIEKYTEIVPVSYEESDMLFNGLTNSIRIKNAVLMPYSPDYKDDSMTEDQIEENRLTEYDKLDFMSEICEDSGLQLITVDVSAGFPMGAQCSCFTCALVDQFYLYKRNGI